MKKIPIQKVNTFKGTSINRQRSDFLKTDTWLSKKLFCPAMWLNWLSHNWYPNIPYGCVFKHWLLHFWSSCLLMCLGSREKQPEIVGPVKKFLAPGFDLGRLQLLWIFGERNSRWEISLSASLAVSPSLCTSNFQVNKINPFFLIHYSGPAL